MDKAAGDFTASFYHITLPVGNRNKDSDQKLFLLGSNLYLAADVGKNQAGIHRANVPYKNSGSTGYDPDFGCVISKARWRYQIQDGLLVFPKLSQSLKCYRLRSPEGNEFHEK